MPFGTCAFVFAALIISTPPAPVYAQTPDTSSPSPFAISNIVDTILNSNEAKISNPEEETLQNAQTALRNEFVSITSKFNQGNALSAYSDYCVLIDKIADQNTGKTLNYNNPNKHNSTNHDILLLNLSKIFYSIGLFSLAGKTSNKITEKDRYGDILLDLEKTYKPKFPLTKDDEIFFAKLYSNIFYINSPEDALSSLAAQKDKYRENDYYFYLTSCAHFALKKYSRALGAINKAIKLNPDNLNYKIEKADILLEQGKYKAAYSLLDKIEKMNPLDLQDDIEIRKQTVLALKGKTSGKNEKERKYHAANVSFLEGNFEKTKKDCLTILNFDKSNDKIIALCAKATLASGDVGRAAEYFQNAFKINKNNPDTLIGLGDIAYIKKDFKTSIKMYKKALKLQKNNPEILIKLACSQREYAKTPKALQKTENLVDKYSKNKNAYLAYFKSAISIAQKNPVLKEDFLTRSLSFNPLYKPATGALVEVNLQNRNFKTALDLINTLTFTLEKNYYYFYLCGEYQEKNNRKKEAIQFYKTSLDLNPNFEAANVRLLKLTPSTPSGYNGNGANPAEDI